MDFDEVAVGVAGEELVDVEFFVVGGRLFDGDVVGLQVGVPVVDVLGDESEDDAVGLLARAEVAAEGLAEAEVGVAAGGVDAAGALVEDEGELQDVFVENGRFCQILRH